MRADRQLLVMCRAGDGAVRTGEFSAALGLPCPDLRRGIGSIGHRFGLLGKGVSLSRNLLLKADGARGPPRVGQSYLVLSGRKRATRSGRSLDFFLEGQAPQKTTTLRMLSPARIISKPLLMSSS